jgi:hypothetical protein
MRIANGKFMVLLIQNDQDPVMYFSNAIPFGSLPNNGKSLNPQ